MSLSFGIDPWLLLPSALGAAVLTVWLYLRTTPEIAPWKRVLLGALRFLALFLIIFLLLEPVLRLIDREERRPILAVLIDNSQSLLLTSSSDSTADSARENVRRLVERLPSHVRDADVRFFTFDSDLTQWDQTPLPTDSLQFRGNRTNIAGALDEVRERLRDENLRAVFLLSDGRYNTGRNPLYTSERYPVPIYTAVLGDTSRHRDVQVRRVTTNEIAYVDAELPVQVGVRTEDMGGEQVTVSIVRDGSVVSSARATLPEGSTEITLDLSVTPESEGLHTYTVAVSRLPGEITHRNNQETFTVRVLRSKRRVLLLGAAPGPDVASIDHLLSSDQTFELTSRVLKSSGTYYHGSFPSSLDEYDIIVLAGYPGRAATSRDIETVREAAEAGTPLFFLLTRNTHIPLVDEHFADVLPIRPEQIRTGSLEAIFSPTASGLSHPILDISGAAPEMWRRLPPLVYNQTRWRASPDADVLAVTEIRGVELDDPMLVIRRRSRNRTAALLGAGTWRWQNVPEDLAQVEHLWPSLFSNTVQWLTARSDDRPVRVVPVRDLFGGDEGVQLSGQVYDESLNPVNRASVEVRITAPDGTVSPYVMHPIGNGRYTLDAGTFPEGTYRYHASATLEGQELGTDDGTFAVGTLTLEFKETRANAPLMRQIAQRSGGGFLEDGRAETFTDRLSASGVFSSAFVEHESEMELRRRYIFLALIIFFLAAEWFVRKRSGMV